ncbi:MAG: cytochrome c [Candidatus Thiodiazotropha sp.]
MKCKNNSFTGSMLSLALTSSLICASPVAWADDIERAVEYRQGVMNVFGWNMKAMSNMMKGKIPFDQKVFAHHAKDLASASGLNLLPGFPEDSESEESDALPEIWMEFDDFEAKYQKLAEAARGLSETEVNGDKASLGRALETTGKACKACHKKYKN